MPLLWQWDKVHWADVNYYVSINLIILLLLLNNKFCSKIFKMVKDLITEIKNSILNIYNFIEIDCSWKQSPLQIVLNRNEYDFIFDCHLPNTPAGNKHIMFLHTTNIAPWIQLLIAFASTIKDMNFNWAQHIWVCCLQKEITVIVKK